MTTLMLDLCSPAALDPLLGVAVPLARRLPARLVGAYVSPAEDMPMLDPAGLSATLQLQLREEMEAGARRQTQALEEALTAALASEGLEGGMISAMTGLGSRSAKLARLARDHHLTVALQSGGINTAVAPEDLVMLTGRPVLVVPEAGRFGEIGRTVLIAWNGSREAARAAFDALVLIQPGARVVILSIDTGQVDPGAGLATGDTLARTLSRGTHRVEAMTRRLAVDSIGSELLNAASDIGADMIVMGAWGHSRLREMILGGATRSILPQMTVPVLMSH